MIAKTEAAVTPTNRLRFFATDMTGSRRVEFDAIDGNRTAGEVAMSVVAAMDLPTDVAWSLRDEGHGRMLDQDRMLGAQIETGAEVAVIPKSHLG